MPEALIIDDNRSTADALCQMLKVLGQKARVAYGSSAAMGLLMPNWIMGAIGGQRAGVHLFPGGGERLAVRRQ